MKSKLIGNLEIMCDRIFWERPKHNLKAVEFIKWDSDWWKLYFFCFCVEYFVKPKH